MEQAGRNRYMLRFVGYSPRIYARLDREFVMFTQKVKTYNITPVYVYVEPFEAVPQIRIDLVKAGAIVETMPENGKWKMIRTINGLYRKYHPLLVDAHFMPFIKVYTAIYSWTHGIKHYTHIRSLIADCTPAEYIQKKGIVKRVLLGINYTLLNTFGKVVCNCGAIERQFREWAYGNKKNVLAIYGGTNIVPPKLTKKEARELLGLQQNTFIITNISAIEHIKGLDLIIRAVAILTQRGVDIQFAHIGGLRSGVQSQIDYADSLKRLASELGVEDRIIWLGRRFDVQDILSAFDAYVHPSRSEGLGGVLLEASVAGLPLVGSRIGGIADVISEGESGYLVENENVEQLADTLQQLIENKDLCIRMGNAAKKRVCDLYDVKKQTDKLIQEYTKG